jgi:hypothetical protein
MTRETEPPDDDLPDNVIAFPIRREAEADPADAKPKTDKPGESDAADAAETSSEPAAETLASDEPSMTIDAFERAVRAAVQDRLGDDPGSPPRGADELVAQVFSALTGKDARSALAEVRSRLAEPSGFVDTRDTDADVIDLGAVREARQKQSLDAATKVGSAIKDTLSGFLSNLAQRQGQTELTLDASFFKQHGPTLLGNLFQSLASAFMQQARSNLTPDPAPSPDANQASAAPPEAAPEASADSDTVKPSATAQPPVQVRLDLASILSGLFRRVSRPPQPEGTPPEEPPKV